MDLERLSMNGGSREEGSQMHQQPASALLLPVICGMVHGVEELVRWQDSLLGVAEHLNPFGFEEPLEVLACLLCGGPVVLRAVTDTRESGQDANLALFGPLEKKSELGKPFGLGRKAVSQGVTALGLVS